MMCIGIDHDDINGTARILVANHHGSREVVVAQTSSAYVALQEFLDLVYQSPREDEIRWPSK